MMKKRVIAWYRQSLKADGSKKHTDEKLLPGAIPFYRDGVSESQYDMVLHEKLDQINDGCQAALGWLQEKSQIKTSSISPKLQWKPKLALIIVTKRHHARLYPKADITDLKQIGTDADDNLQGGMVADNGIVTPTHFSFYLQSHYSPLGTARSSYYHVIFDECKYGMRELQNIVSHDYFQFYPERTN
jgi:eukaryotic translation initiation factor 2C